MRIINITVFVLVFCFLLSTYSKSTCLAHKNITTYPTSTYQIHGKLKHKDSKLPIEFATIGVRSYQTDSLITSMITDSKGEFSFAAKPGEYNLHIRCMGYTPMVKHIQVYDQDIYLKPIDLVIENNALDEVNITGSSYSEQHDKSIQIITKQFKEGTNNVTDLLTKIRGIDVDPLDNSIKINNEDNVLLLVNGIRKEQKYIKNLSPDRISRIEVTGNPTGRYISDGYTAIVNIILKKNYTGYDAYINDKALFSLDQSNGDEVLFNNEASMNLTYTLKRAL